MATIPVFGNVYGIFFPVDIQHYHTFFRHCSLIGASAHFAMKIFYKTTRRETRVRSDPTPPCFFVLHAHHAGPPFYALDPTKSLFYSSRQINFMKRWDRSWDASRVWGRHRRRVFFRPTPPFTLVETFACRWVPWIGDRDDE